MGVWAALEPASSSVEPGGGPGTHTLRVRNNGDTVEEYGLSVVGPIARWADVTPDRLRIYPGDEATATINVAVPRTPDAAAGPAPFGVRVIPRVHPELSDVAEGTVTIAPFGLLQADLNPVTVRGRISAPLRISVDNRGNAPLPIRLEGRDDEDALRFAAADDTIQVPAGVAERPALRVRPRRRRLTGRPERFPFVVTVTPGEAATAVGAQPMQLRGTYVRLALLPGWLLWSLLALLLAGTAAVVLVSLPSTNLQRLLFPVPPVPVAAGVPTTLPQTPSQQTALPQPSTPQASPRQQPEQQQPPANRVTVTISHGGLALAAVDDPRDQNAEGPGQGVLPVDATPLRDRAWTIRDLQDGSVVIGPAAADDLVLAQPDLDDTSLVELTRVVNGQPLGAGETWLLRQTDNGFTIVNRATGACLTDVGNGRSTVGADCRPQPAQAQIWILERS